MSEPIEYAIPLFALIDREKVDLSKPFPDEFAEHLQVYLENQLGIALLSTEILILGEEPYLILHGVAAEGLPALCSLVDVQRTQLFKYERASTDEATLTPLNVKI